MSGIIRSGWLGKVVLVLVVVVVATQERAVSQESQARPSRSWPRKEQSAERADTKQRATLTNSKQQATTSRPIAKPASQSASHLLAEEETDKKAGSGSGSTGSSNCPTDCSFGLWDEP